MASCAWSSLLWLVGSLLVPAVVADDHWSYTTWTTIPATTTTITAETYTQKAITVPGLGWAVTIKPTTYTVTPTTITVGPVTLFSQLPPEKIAAYQESYPNAVYLMSQYNQQLASADESVLSKLDKEASSMYKSWDSIHPQPTVSLVHVFLYTLLREVDATEEQAKAIEAEVNLIPNTGEESPDLLRLLAPFPDLSSSIHGYATAFGSWAGPRATLEASLFAKFFLGPQSTTAAPNSTTTTSSTVESTTAFVSWSVSSGNAAAPTVAANVVANAGIVAAGMAVIAML